MQVGYLPDMFGHVAQMPQLLRLAGLEHAVVWRGVPPAITQTAFWWEAPDGSRVRAEYLYGSYSNGRDLPDDAKRLVGRARDYEAELGTVRIADMLLMNGTDHQMPQLGLGRVVAEANQIQDDYQFVVTSLAEYLPTQPVEGLATWRGELRSGARANVLMGVASNRVDIHRACAAAERAVDDRPAGLDVQPVERLVYQDRVVPGFWRWRGHGGPTYTSIYWLQSGEAGHIIVGGSEDVMHEGETGAGWGPASRSAGLVRIS